jgi:hypothetical protein
MTVNERAIGMSTTNLKTDTPHALSDTRAVALELLHHMQADAIRRAYDRCYSYARRARYEGLSTGISAALSALEPCSAESFHRIAASYHSQQAQPWQPIASAS